MLSDTDTTSCLFVGEQGLFLVYCAFKVVCIQAIAQYEIEDVVWVSSVKTSTNGTLVYEIEGQHFYHYYFALIG